MRVWGTQVVRREISPVRGDLHEMGVQMVSDSRAWESMVFSLLLWPNDMSGATKVTWNSLHRCKTFLTWLWWHVLGALHSPGCRSGLFLLLVQQPLPGRREGPFFHSKRVWKDKAYWKKANSDHVWKLSSENGCCESVFGTFAQNRPLFFLILFYLSLPHLQGF